MCGFFGLIVKNEDLFLQENYLDQYLNLLTNRGPDNQKYKVITKKGKQIFLAHSRLAIQDLSDESIQPFVLNSSPDKLLVYNGEIYNFESILEDSNSYPSDTAALYNYLLTSNPDISKLDGIFSFAFLDIKELTLSLVRDRFGTKPLFYYNNNDYFIFSSSLRMIQATSPSPLKLCEGYINEVVNYGYTHDSSTVFENVYKLPPNSFCSINLKDFKINSNVIHSNSHRQKPYTTTPGNIQNVLARSLDNVLLQQISKSKRGTGIFLSGGVDSSLLFAKALTHNNNFYINSFSSFVHGKDTNESHRVSKFLKNFENNSRLTTNSYEFNHTNIKSVLDDYKYLDYPVADLSILPFMHLCKSLPSDFKVLLSGDGADEIFLGYKRTFDSYFRFMLINFKPFKKVLKLINKIGLGGSLRKYLNVAYPTDVRNILSDSPPRHLKPSNDQDYFSQLTNYDIEYYLVSVLEKVDAASMLYSKEVRVPYLSNPIVDIAFHSPTKYLSNNFRPKFLLKNILETYTSSSFVNLDKKGFSFDDSSLVNSIDNYIKTHDIAKLPLSIKINNKSARIRFNLLRIWLDTYLT